MLPKLHTQRESPEDGEKGKYRFQEAAKALARETGAPGCLGLLVIEGAKVPGAEYLEVHETPGGTYFSSRCTHRSWTR